VSKNVERLTNLGRLDDQRALLPEDLIAEVVFKTTRGKMEDQELKLTKSQKLGIEIARFEDLINENIRKNGRPTRPSERY